jgi:uncharacterized protein YbgA (DUF1722 family)
MIEKVTYKSYIKKVLLLAGQTPDLAQLDAIYERIKDYELDDFINACNDDELIEAWSFRVSYPALKRVLDKHMADRLEREAKERRERERRELEELIKSEQAPSFVKDFLMRIKSL